MTLPPYPYPRLTYAEYVASLDHGTMGIQWILKEIRKAEKKWVTD